MSMGLALMWPNITIVVNVVFLEILALARARQIVNRKRVMVQKK